MKFLLNVNFINNLYFLLISLQMLFYKKVLNDKKK